MKSFKYQTTTRGVPKEIWACENCKRSNSDNILLKKWRLIDHREDAEQGYFLCDICNSNKMAANE
ncbi:MAG: hypothetical protein OEY01_04485 [Desulfobulbaceae bacterium]|nr:hypothetical protein [Desulfobulbaceae bacterium]